MASIENRSRFVVTIHKREDLTKTFAYTREEKLPSYRAELKAAGHKPILSRTDDSFAIRVRDAGHRKQCLYANSLDYGIMRPKYFNERDRRLKEGEEKRLINAAYDEDAQKSIEQCLEELMSAERRASIETVTTYRRKNIIKAARAQYLAEAEATYTHVPWMETFVQFQLMTGARRSETMWLTWSNIDFGQQTAFIPETKNGRPRKLPLRSHVIALLQQLPRNGEMVFPMSLDALRKAWGLTPR